MLYIKSSCRSWYITYHKSWQNRIKFASCWWCPVFCPIFQLNFVICQLLLQYKKRTNFTTNSSLSLFAINQFQRAVGNWKFGEYCIRLPISHILTKNYKKEEYNSLYWQYVKSKARKKCTFHWLLISKNHSEFFFGCMLTILWSMPSCEKI